MEVVIRNLKHLRVAQGWSLENVAETAKTTYKIYQRFESKGGKIDPNLLERLAALYGLTVSDLYKEDLNYTLKIGSNPNLKEDSGDYKAAPKSRVVHIPLDLGNDDELKIFKLYIGSQMAARLS